MNEKKKVIIGFGAVLAGAFAASWFTTYGDYKKDEGIIPKIVRESLEEKKYDLNVDEREVAAPYKKLDMEKIEKILKDEESQKKKEPITVTKTDEIKNEKGTLIAKKNYRSDGSLEIINYKEKKEVYREFTKEEKGRYEGESTKVYPDGTKQTYTYKKGVKDGKATIEYSNGDKEVYSYDNGVPTGQGIYYFINGDREEYTYKDGLMEGPAKYIYSDGRIEKYNYVKGERK